MIIHKHSYRNNSYRNSRGFTLVEALVGLVILALGLLSLARFHTSLIESSGLTKARTAAINYGQDKMEELRNLIAMGDFTTTSPLCDASASTEGSVVTDSTAAVTQLSTNTQLSQTWTVTPLCDPPRHQIEVSVSWVDAKGINQTILLSSLLTWMDPAKASINISDSSNFTPTIPFPDGRSTVGDGTVSLPSPSVTRTPTGIDNTDIVTTSDGTFYLVDSADFILLTSAVPIVSISGIIGRDAAVTTTTLLQLSTLIVATSHAGYCFYPLKSDGTPGFDASTPNQAAYVCYVAEDWYGGVGFFGYADGFGGGAKDDVCPAKARQYKSIRYASGGITPIGQFGIKLSQSGDDFLITKLGGGSCASITVPSDFTDTNADNVAGPLEDALVTTTTTTDGVVTHTISGAIIIDTNPTPPNPPANSKYTSLSIAAAGSPSNGTCTSAVFNPGATFATYSCVVGNNWSGTITLSGANGSDTVCFNGASANIINFSALTSDSSGNIFDIVENTVTCP